MLVSTAYDGITLKSGAMIAANIGDGTVPNLASVLIVADVDGAGNIIDAFCLNGANAGTMVSMAGWTYVSTTDTSGLVLQTWTWMERATS